LWTFSYFGATKSLSLRVERRTSDVIWERANVLIGCQKAEAGDAGLCGMDLEPDRCMMGTEPLALERERAEILPPFPPMEDFFPPVFVPV
jgi:hypothetical protein